MAEFLVVGSGATGVHFAQTMLERGHDVTLLDVGFERPEPPHPDSAFMALKDALDDDGAYFLGPRGEAVVYPSAHAKPYGFPPSKEYVFRRPAGEGVVERGFHPMLSYARGGLAEAWTGGSYELRDEEFVDFPFRAGDMRPHYATVARRIGVTAAPDDLQRFSPLTAPYLPPLEPDAHSAWIAARYAQRRERVNALGVHLGRSRVAVLSRDHGSRRACGELGRCLWGCPRGALYRPSLTLADLQQHARFVYRPGVQVRRVLVAADGRAAGVVAMPLGGGSEFEVRADRVILAAGALATSLIYLETRLARGETDPSLAGLMDNRHVMVPFVNLARLGAKVELDSYQFHMLAMAIDTGDWRHDVHGQVTALKAAAVHPIVAPLPFDLATSRRVFQRMRAALGVANIWLADTRRDVNRARIQQRDAAPPQLVLEYGDDSSDLPATERAIATTRRALGALGCIAPRGMVQVLERGSSVHYAGTIPMTHLEQEHTCRPDGEVRGLPGLHVVDGAGFPWLPAKNITFSLMANAVRIAELLA
ncbi:MAG: GMC family oxidoreductase [Gemmatimonadaceae bacterium]|nr:GMC family oxidoreductase [Gemmatimonadaceae bacterium]